MSRTQERPTNLRRIQSDGDIPRADTVRSGYVGKGKGKETDDVLERSYSHGASARLAQQAAGSAQPASIPLPPSKPPSPPPAEEAVLPPPQSPLNAPSVPPRREAPPAMHEQPAALDLAHIDRRLRRHHNLSLYTRTMAFFGYGAEGTRKRRADVSLLFNLGFSFTQIVVVITMVVLSKKTASRTDPAVNQWDACNRPLGIWACLWIARVVVASNLAYWGYTRDRHSMSPRSDVETNASSGTAHPPPLATRSSQGTSNNNTNRPSNPNSSTDDNESRPSPRSGSYRTFSLLSSILSITWFLIAHIFEYTSVNTCRVTSPYLWWLIFGILCITYLMIVEVLVLGIIVFVLAPIIFLFYNILLMCLGRHPVQHPGINPEIGKLPQTLVEKIPLVMYIPPPPDGEHKEKDGLEKPTPAHMYPPQATPASTAQTPKRHRFKFLRRKKALNAPSAGKDSAKNTKTPLNRTGPPKTWEEHFEPEGYPFVVLESNRAACAICLMDFEEPKRYVPEGEQEAQVEKDSQQQEKEKITEDNAAESGANAISEELRLEDAGEGAQPLRLLACGHVFHKPCLDPWLTTVSGRCPVCQTVVDAAALSGKKQRP